MVCRQTNSSVEIEVLAVDDLKVRNDLINEIFDNGLARRQIREIIHKHNHCNKNNKNEKEDAESDFLTNCSILSKREKKLHKNEKVVSRIITSLRIALLRLDDSIDGIEKEDWVLWENLMHYRRAIHKHIDDLLILKKKVKFTQEKVILSMTSVGVYKISMDAPDDMQGIVHLIENNTFNAEEIVAIIVKTEGNGNVNDFTRGFATYRIQTLFSEYLNCSRSNVSERVSIVCSGGCEGVMSPHATVFVKGNRNKYDHDKKRITTNNEKKLAIGTKNTRELLPEEIGTPIHAKEVAKGVERRLWSMQVLMILKMYTFVQIKCPLLTSGRINNADKRRKKVVTRDTLKSMAFSRGDSALGVSIALQEVDERRVTESTICNDWGLYSSVASASAGIELMNNEIVVMGNSNDSSSSFVIGHSVMKSPIDSNGVRDALRNTGLSFNGCTLSEKDSQRLVNVFAKAGAHPSGIVMGRRTTMLTDSDIQ